MYGIIVTAHNNFPSGLYSGLKLVCGDMENVKVVDYLESQSYEDLDNNLKIAFYEMSKYEKVIFMTDLLGGTPFSRSVLNFGDNKNVRVLTGLNFPMLYAASVMQESDDMDKDIQEIISLAREGITVYQMPVKKEQEIDEDGI